MGSTMFMMMISGKGGKRKEEGKRKKEEVLVKERGGKRIIPSCMLYLISESWIFFKAKHIYSLRML